jgi:GrpB-like predicted nucleotidyltransferase (UPF0157 family)
MGDTVITIVPYKPSWPEAFREIAGPLRLAVGDAALAIHHIGSTSVPGLAAKDIIDIQMTVADFDQIPVAKVEALGYTFRNFTLTDHCPPGMEIAAIELEKRYFACADRPIHLHVRQLGRFNQRYPLLCRDYLRTHPMAANAYAEIKRQLAHYFPNDVDAYYAIKDPVFDAFMAGAFEWATFTNWQLPPTDA